MVSIAKDEAERDDGLSMADARRSDYTDAIANRSARSDVEPSRYVTIAVKPDPIRQKGL